MSLSGQQLPKHQIKYPPKLCAFHPHENIFNFCRNKECLLPLCPTCIDLHTQQHKNQKTYGKFQNLGELVNQLAQKLDADLKTLQGFKEQIEQQLQEKSIDEVAIWKNLKEAKQKVIGLVGRFFDNFEKQVQKSVKQFNISMKQNYRQMNHQIQSMDSDINAKIANLSSDKILKTVIGYYAKQQDHKISNNLDVMRQTLQLCSHKRVNLISENSSIKKMVNQLSKYMYLSFQNWENEVKYETSDFVKTGFTHNTQASNYEGGNYTQRSRLSQDSSHSRTCSITNRNN